MSDEPKLIPDEDLEDLHFSDHRYHNIPIGTWSIADVVNAARFLTTKHGVAMDEAFIELGRRQNDELDPLIRICHNEG